MPRHHTPHHAKKRKATSCPPLHRRASPNSPRSQHHNKSPRSSPRSGKHRRNSSPRLSYISRSQPPVLRMPRSSPSNSPRSSPKAGSQSPKAGSQSPRTKGKSSCVVTQVWEDTRQSLAAFAGDEFAFKKALTNMPWQGTFNNDQRDMITFLRKHYAKYAKNTPGHKITIERHRCVDMGLNNTNARIPIPRFREGNYDDKCMAVVDFANEIIGGGFLTKGFVQEEVMTIQHFDMAMMLAKQFSVGAPVRMHPAEAIIIKGAGLWCLFDYYGKVPPDWAKKTKVHTDPKRGPDIIALDCIEAKETFLKYSQTHLLWLLRKAYVGFQAVQATTIATGHWGGGIFKNNKNVVFCIQFIAAALANKSLRFYAFGQQDKSSIKGFNLVLHWHTMETPVANCLNDLYDKCQSDKDFFAPTS
eukprot:GEMP01038673.1.p1 GENE.GEMP01038673.1~~GEMP01038673.1.p1  ORF type:complete len:415 (+),score=70.19 GEMP01038673.1:202-1446(+)